jgi:hypothetical protein
MNDVMIDIETLGTTFDAVITQIGACYFDRQTGDIGDKFEVNVEIGSCLAIDLKVTPGSIKFWLERQPTWFKDTKPIQWSLAKLGDFLNKDKKKPFIWSHATFDPIVLASAYARIKQGLPYSYRNLRDIRTLVDLSGVKKEKPKEGEEKNDKSHDALEDCIYQVKYCVECFKNISHS